MQSRYYNPEVGRFLNADAFASTGQGLLGNNMFVYCLNNPINFIDCNGKFAESALSWWTATMWLLCLVDAFLPIGDIIYAAGFVSLLLLVTVTNTGSSASITSEYTLTEASKGSSSQKKNSVVSSGGGTPKSPKPPKKNNNEISFSKEFRGDTTYNKDGVRIDYEYNGNGTGNVHIHTKGGKFYYDYQGFLKVGPGNSASASASIQKLLRDYAILKAIYRALKTIEGLGGKLI